MKRSHKKPIIGWREWVLLPDLGTPWIKAKIDTGARSSCLHAFDLQEFERDGQPFIRFSVHPRQRSLNETVVVESPLLERRKVRSSNGKAEERFVTVTSLTILNVTFEIELTLSNRSNMGFRMLLGRQALRRRFLIDPGKSFLGGKPAGRSSKNRHPSKPSNKDQA